MGLHDEHRKRVKNRFILNGLEDWEPHQVLEMLLFYAIPQKDTNELAHKLINHFGSLHAVFEASYSELAAVKGVGEHTAVLLSMILPLLRKYNSDRMNEKLRISSSTECGEYLLNHYLGCTSEKVCVLCADRDGIVRSINTLCDGNSSSATFTARELMNIVSRHNTAYVILSHNHPSELALPSKEDVEVTITIANALKKVGIKLVDHMIFSSDDFVSMADSAEYRYLFR